MTARLYLEQEKCVGCGACLPACPAGALAQGPGGIPAVDDSRCTLCGLCRDACPVGALAIKQAGRQVEDIAGYQGIWVFAECTGSTVLPVAFELLGEARRLADAEAQEANPNANRTRVTALLLGHDVAGQAAALVAAGADEVLLCEGAVFRGKLVSPHATATVELVRRHRPAILLFGATAFGRSLAPRVAARLRTGLTADCTQLTMGEDGLLQQTRPAFGGNLMATIVTPGRRPQMATVRPGVMAALPPDAARTGHIRQAPPPADAGLVQLLETVAGDAAASIAGAKIIVSAGRGIGAQKNLALVHQLAEKLGGAVGVSRPLVDMGWAAYPHQIGQTGLVVAPDLLLCFGISGAIQHLAGMGGAKRVIAVNSDADAPIFGVADHKVVGDAVAVLKALLAELDAEN